MDAEAVPGLIGGYLAELRQSLGRLPDADDVVAEAEDHLLETADRLVAQGLERFEAEVRAVSAFGSPAHVSRAFVLEARKGGAVATSFTRRCGLIALLAPVSFVVGLVGSSVAGDGLVNHVAIALGVLGGVGIVPALVGLRVRHGGLGMVGRVAFWTAVLALPAAMPFGYAGFIVLGVLLGTSFTLWGVGMLRAAVLPRVPVTMFGFSALVFWAFAWAVTAAGGEAGLYLVLPVAPTAAGLCWLGWAMWNEPAVDVPGPPAAFAQ